MRCLGGSFCGFGLRAGFVPLHGWLPDAYRTAPPEVAAVLSAVASKAGAYGFQIGAAQSRRAPVEALTRHPTQAALLLRNARLYEELKSSD